MRCASCSSDNPEGTKFCHECGGALQNRCPSCGFENALLAKFCGNCGTALKAEGKAIRAKSRSRKGAQTPRRAPRASRPPVTAPSRPASPEAERRQLTVMFCDLVGSTPLAEKLDPEELRQVIIAYQEMCAHVIRRFEGYLARYIGDGLLVYFGYPVAHEDDAARAARTGLGILEALPALNARLPRPIQVRIGIHTGLVVVGEIGSREKREMLALGETPNIAARLQGVAEPDTVVLSAVTQRLVAGLFECQDLGPQALKGISTSLPVYRVVHESAAQSRFEVAVSTGLTPLDGRMAKTPYVFCYRIRNWYEYNRALINHGHLTVGFDEQAITAWRNIAPGRGPGAPRAIAFYSKSRNRTVCMAGQEWVHALERRREYDVPLQDPVRRAASGAKPRHATH